MKIRFLCAIAVGLVLVGGSGFSGSTRQGQPAIASEAVNALKSEMHNVSLMSGEITEKKQDN